MMLQTAYVEKSSITASTKPHIPEYEAHIEQIAKLAIDEQSPKQLKKIRGMFYELLTKGIPGDHILVKLTHAFFESMPERVHSVLSDVSVNCDMRLRAGSKDIIHLEAFTATVMMVKRQS